MRLEAVDGAAVVPLMRNAGQIRFQPFTETVKIVCRQQVEQSVAGADHFHLILAGVGEQALAETQPHFQIGEGQREQPRRADPLLPGDGQIASLEHQRPQVDVGHIETGKQLRVRREPLKLHWISPLPHDLAVQHLRRAGLEPVRFELAAAEQQQDVVGVVELFFAAPMVAVVPVADLVPVEAIEFGCEHGVKVPVGIAADRGEGGVQADVFQIVQAREQAHPGEHADPGDEDEADQAGAVLDDAVEAPQVFAVGFGDLRFVERVENRLVVFVDKHHDPPAGFAMQPVEQVPESRGPRHGFVRRRQTGIALDDPELGENIGFQVVQFDVFAAEAEMDDGMLVGPVPLAVDGEPPEQRLIAGEQFAQRVEQQAFAETAGAREEVIPPLAHELVDQGRLVHIIATRFPESLEILDADWEPGAGHDLGAESLRCVTSVD